MAIAEQGDEYDEPKEDDESQTASLRKWTSRSTGDPISPLDSGPSSPEFSASSIDGSRPPRHNRYLSGLQKITRLAKPKASLSAFSDSGGRGGRRMSDAEVDPRRSSQEKGSSSDLSGRIRGMLDKGAKGATGELIKQPASVPSSPVAAHGVKSTCVSMAMCRVAAQGGPTGSVSVFVSSADANTQEEGRMGGGEGRLRRPSAGGSTFQSARAGVGETGLGGRQREGWPGRLTAQSAATATRLGFPRAASVGHVYNELVGLARSQSLPRLCLRLLARPPLLPHRRAHLHLLYHISLLF